MTDIPSLSVLMPVYNSEEFLVESINSILNQTFGDFEFLIVDDASTDNSRKIIQSFLDSRIRLICNAQNFGVAISLNVGIQMARGRYIARMDADDISAPVRLGKQVEYLKAHENIGVLGCAVQLIDEFDQPRQILKMPEQHNFIRWCLCFFNPLIHPAVMMRRSAIERVGGYDITCKRAQDYDLWWRLSPNVKIANLPDVLLSLRKHPRNVSFIHMNDSFNTAMMIKQRAISGLLGEVVPIDIIQSLSQPLQEDIELTERTLVLIYKLFCTFSRRNLSLQERWMIRKDAAMRLCTLAFHSAKKNSLRWLVVSSSLDPLVTARMIARRIRRITHTPLTGGKSTGTRKVRL